MSKVLRKCIQCEKEFEVYPSQVKRGGGKFCSIGYGTTYRNIHNNPSKREDVRKKISENHADFSGKKNPMFGVRGEQAPAWKGKDVSDYRKKAFRNLPNCCDLCGSIENLGVHHKNKNRKDNDLSNLQILCRTCHLGVHERRRCKTTGRFLKESDANVNY